MIRDTSSSDTIVARKQPYPVRLRMAMGVALLVTLLTGGFFVHSVASPWLQADRTVSAERIRIAKVERGTFERSILVQGTVDAVVRPTLYGLADGVVTLHVKAGDTVTKDQLLAEIDNPELRNKLDQEDSRLAQTANEYERLRLSTNQQELANEQEVDLQEIDLQAAKRGLARAADALRIKVMAKKDFELAQDELAAAETRMKHSRARIVLENERLNFELQSKRLEVDRQKLVVDELRRQFDQLSIISPTDGLVGNILVQERDKVASNQALMTVVNLSAYEVLVTIPESYADDLNNQMKAVISVQGQDLVGTLASVSPEVIDGHVEGRVTLDSDVTSVLKQKQRLSVKLVLESKEDALVVARGPFLEDGAGRIAYVVENGLATAREITTGAVGVSSIEIVDGLAVDDQIIISSINGFEQAKTVLIR